MIDIDKYRKDVEAICRELSLVRLDIVGSASRSDFAPDSDVDVLVTFAEGDHLFRRYFELKEKLEQVFERPVDVIEERAIRNPYVKTMLGKDRVRIYGA